MGGYNDNEVCNSHSSIVTGQLNVVSGAFGFIGSGRENTVTGDCSAILGGSGNSAGHDWAGIFGCDISSVLACAFHANNIVVPDMPIVGTTIPGKTLYYRNCGTGNCPVYIC